MDQWTTTEAGMLIMWSNMGEIPAVLRQINRVRQIEVSFISPFFLLTSSVQSFFVEITCCQWDLLLKQGKKVLKTTNYGPMLYVISNQTTIIIGDL